MPNQLTSFAMDTALVFLATKALVALTRNNIEIEDAGYRRQPYLPGNPYQWDGNTQVISNDKEILWGPWRTTADGLITGWALLTEGGKVLATGPIKAREDEKPPLAGDVVIMGAREISMGFQGSRR